MFKKSKEVEIKVIQDTLELLHAQIKRIEKYPESLKREEQLAKLENWARQVAAKLPNAGKLAS